ncbi:sugar phosphate isomerase/epimerase [Paenibacillus sp. 1011MAR3C5]|uniref:TIM barrel protein n=1 Tax=Paenibacillus sp. 1011MAR3C5 TaxID=1675787 RepID=UPI000E6C095E|nr:TIM barrel protein [Paenibacillus sp. 1011MAR3C5]RJE87496.1 sugar phosphate isomerase/epimerase [Paenibacillus sp. 1011MAR3C5]
MRTAARSRFIIGQYGSFDFKKYERDFRTGFFGIEACLFERGEDVELLRREAAASRFSVGIHFPLRPRRGAVRDALFLSEKEEVRREAYEAIGQELEYLRAKELHPAYVLFHYSKPVILDDRVAWSQWRFVDKREYVYEGRYSLDELKIRSRSLFAWLTDKAAAYGFRPILEFDGLSRYVYEDEFLIELLEQYPKIRLCMDTARLYLQERIDCHFDARAVLQKYAKYADLIHLSNLQLDPNNTVLKSRYPALPTQHPGHGWAPIEDYLDIALGSNPQVNIMFEHRSDLVSDKELEACYAWVEQLMLRYL